MLIVCYLCLIWVFFVSSVIGFTPNSAMAPVHVKRQCQENNEGSEGVNLATEWLNSSLGQALLLKFAERDEKLKKEMEKSNFWTGGSFTLEAGRCTNIAPDGINVSLDVNIRGKKEKRDVKAPFPFKVDSEDALKIAIVALAIECERINLTAPILELPFGRDFTLPLDLLFNNVPHPAWLRAYIYSLAAEALKEIVRDPDLGPFDRTHLQIRVNFPEVNPAFDTYRIGTMLEMVREMALGCVFDGKRVRICVQQALGSGIFTGLPLAIASMRPVMEQMDWGLIPGEAPYKPHEERYGQEDANVRIRFGTVGADVLSDDDDVVIVIAPQNVVGGAIMNPLEDMVRAAEAAGKTLVLVCPNLVDRPSSNDQMQIRGRKERREFADSFKDLFVLKLLYPSTGGYMYPIRGMLMKRGLDEPYVLYDHIERNDEGRDEFRILAGFPRSPDANVVSDQFKRKRRKKS